MEDLALKSVPITLYSSKDPDLGIPCVIKKIEKNNDQILIFYQSPGEENQEKILLKQLDAVVLRYPFINVNLKKEIGIITKIYLKYSNRGSNIKYI